MARTQTVRRPRADAANGKPAGALQKRAGGTPASELESDVHRLGPGIICDTDRRGHPTPRGRDPREIVVDASEGFIPLWAGDVTLRWRFREWSMNYFADPDAAKEEIRNLLAEALLAWGAAAPVTFTHDDDLWDFEIVMRSADQCTGAGCVLAAAFFPDAGRHELELYPKMFTQVRKEQVETLIHEIGHTFGLRHFFANVSETAWPSEIFGTHSKFSIMNYGALSELTTADKDDLSRLYQMAWAGELTHINGTPIRLVRPYSSLAAPPDGAVAVAEVPAAFRPRPADQSRAKAAYLGRR